MLKDEYVRRIGNVGSAYTIPQFIMLMGHLEVLFKNTQENLMTTDADGDIVASRLNFEEEEKNRILTSKISTAPALTRYRTIAEDNEVASFTEVVAIMKKKVLAVIPFQDHQQELKTALAATVDTQPPQQLTFQSEITYGNHQDDKRQRTEAVRPCVSAQPYGHYWDEKECEYEK